MAYKNKKKTQNARTVFYSNIKLLQRYLTDKPVRRLGTKDEIKIKAFEVLQIKTYKKWLEKKK